MDNVRERVTKKVHKEYREFMDRVRRNSSSYAIDNSIKISFYKEIHIYVLNGIVRPEYYAEMERMENIIETLWERFDENSVKKPDMHFLNELMEFHIRNRERMKENAQDQ